MALTITKKYEEQEEKWVLDIAGEIDLNATPNFKSILNQCIQEKPANIQLNCQSLMFIDSTGIGAIINAYKKINKDYTIIIHQPRDNVKKLLQITGLTNILTINV